MPDTPTSDARRRRRRGRGRPNNSNNNSNSPTPSSYFQKQPKQTGLQKFLSVISFGLLGQPKPKQKSKQASAPPVRFEGGNRADRGERPERRNERGERNEKSERGERSGDRSERPQREPRAPREPRPAPVPAEVTSGRLYVGNLSYDATEGDLFELFNGVGKVQNAEVVVNNRTQRSKGFAFVTMATIDEAKRAVAELNNKDFMGRSLQISGAKPVTDRGDESAAEATPGAGADTTETSA